MVMGGRRTRGIRFPLIGPLPSEFVKDHYFRLLADEHRRDLLEALQDEKSHSIPTRKGDSQEVKLRLYHVHLPLLEDAGLVEWNREGHAITRGSNYEEVKPVMEFLRTHPVPSSD